MLRTYALAALLSAVGAYKLPAIGTRVSHATPSTRASVRLDEDRCYYGKLDADGNVLLEDEVEVLDRVENAARVRLVTAPRERALQPRRQLDP